MSEPNESNDLRDFRLYHLPVAAKLCIAAFLLSVGVGYFSALVQLHFQQATPGHLLPSSKSVVDTFHGPRGTPQSQLERLITADENLPWNGSGQMSAAFTTKSDGWKAAIKKRVGEMRKRLGRRVDAGGEEALKEEAEKELRGERATERDVVLAWLKAGASKEEYEADKYCLSPELAGRPITKDFGDEDADGKFAKIKSILDARCARCHTKPEAAEDQKAATYPLDTHQTISKYTKVQTGPTMSLEKLTQTTHIHLLSFSMLYFLTGLALALTRYPWFIKVPLASIPLVVQVIDIACWWLARIPGETGVMFALAIPITGAIVGAGLGLQIVLTVWDLFNWRGKAVLVLLFLAAGYGALEVKNRVIVPHLEAERAATAAAKK